jgi:type II secretory pathway component GspD/PulD (secretin)
MKRLTESVLVSIVVLAAGAALAAPSGQHEAISLDLEEADIGDVLKTVAMIIDAEAEIDPAVVGQVSITFDGISWMTALDAICESGSCGWRLTGRHPRLLEVAPAEPLLEAAADPLDQPIKLSLKEAHIGDVFSTVSKLAQWDLETDGELEGSVTLSFKGVSLRTALNMVCESAGCVWELGEDGVLQVVYADPETPAAGIEEVSARLEQPVTLRLNNADVGKVLENLGKLIGCELLVSAEVTGPVTVDLEGAATHEVLTRVCEAVGSRWILMNSSDGVRIEVVPQ